MLFYCNLLFHHGENLQRLKVNVALTLRVNPYKFCVYACFPLFDFIALASKELKSLIRDVYNY